MSKSIKLTTAIELNEKGIKELEAQMKHEYDKWLEHKQKHENLKEEVRLRREMLIAMYNMQHFYGKDETIEFIDP